MGKTFNMKCWGYLIFAIFGAFTVFCYFTRQLQEDWFIYVVTFLFIAGVVLVEIPERRKSRGISQNNKV